LKVEGSRFKVQGFEIQDEVLGTILRSLFPGGGVTFSGHPGFSE
jgi:hypothetical protein